jgi:Mrp family chromosome partitioning ATPase
MLHDKAFWQSLRQSFDFVVIDAPSLKSSSDGIAFAQRADATVLVTSAETTRRHVLENLRDTLKNAGATISGIVLNKRKFYIPERIYKKL